MNRELLLEELLQAAYANSPLPVYDLALEKWGQDSEAFRSTKSLVDELVEEKLLHFNDAQRTQVQITNYGRYWMSHGGYMEFLKGGERKQKEHHEHSHHGSNHSAHELQMREELREARLKFTRYRIVTYWWSFGLSLISFFLSLLSIFLIVTNKK
ncbi:hypothetical protein KJS94_14010 [Flavihumibacter rivuli]|uniref:hypothetical protein n=1 Tax=Flavihumibacter rivuli TaxID=2838156 RepID=UPI001BDDF7A1|nr:hypothetical protein [Flavihumibacter rivuli]ULQ55759.1 hypothetical protein KJS94_14010 [Flavihumibacter rivuli]